MDIFDCIYTRRSIRKFKDIPVELDKLYEIIKAGSYAPCAGDLQNWKFIVEKNNDKIKAMYHHSLEQEAFMTAQIAVIVVAETDMAEKFYGMRGKRLYAVQNCAAAMQNMLLAAHALGLGAVWIGAFDENRINDTYKIPSVARAQGIILLGYPDEVPAPRHVKYIWYITQYNKYGMKYEYHQRIMNDLSMEWEMQSKNLQRMVNRKLNKTKKKLGIEKDATLQGEVKARSKNFFEQAKARATNALGRTKNGDATDKRRPKESKGWLDGLKKPKNQQRSRRPAPKKKQRRPKK